MPNRILKESICRSDEINDLSWQNEALFYRLMVNADDFGRFDGRTRIIRGALFPLKDIDEAEIEEGLNELARQGLIIRYHVCGKPFVALATWDEHQNVRAKKSKYPSPEDTGAVIDEIPHKEQKIIPPAVEQPNEPEKPQGYYAFGDVEEPVIHIVSDESNGEQTNTSDSNCKQMLSYEKQMIANACNCMQMNTDASKCSRNPIQSNPNTNPNTNPNPNTYICSERKTSEQEDVAPVIAEVEQTEQKVKRTPKKQLPKPFVAAEVESLILNDGTDWFPSVDDVAEWQKAFPAVDVVEQFRRMHLWCKDNASRRKTSSGVRRFVTSWLRKQQDAYHPANTGSFTGGSAPRGSAYIDGIKNQISDMASWSV